MPVWRGQGQLYLFYLPRCQGQCFNPECFYLMAKAHCRNETQPVNQGAAQKNAQRYECVCVCFVTHWNPTTLRTRTHQMLRLMSVYWRRTLTVSEYFMSVAGKQLTRSAWYVVCKSVCFDGDVYITLLLPKDAYTVRSEVLGRIFLIEDTWGRYNFLFKISSIGIYVFYRLLRGRTVFEKLPKIYLVGPSLIHQLRLLGSQQHP
jgi:hypothetical protein